MFYYLSDYTQLWPPLNVFQYVTFRAMGAALTALLLCILIGPWLIQILRRFKLGQPLRYTADHKELADLHGSKKGTPTMGGLLILIAVSVSSLLWGRLDNLYLWVTLFATLSLGLLGFVDDALKIRKKQGISSKQKFLGQILIALLVSLFFLLDESRYAQVGIIQIPFLKQHFIPHLGWWVLPFLVLVIVGSSNAVNLTDGLDGLATGCTISVALVYAVFAYIVGHAVLSKYLFFDHIVGVEELTVFCAGLAGAGLGFLWFNAHPAQIFMGDTGSLAIGGSLAVVAIAVNQELLLVIVGGVFVIEAMSVILQVASFKMTGKRLFAMSPIHHHFELKGWPETKVVIRFWIVSVVFALVGLATLKLR